MDGRNGIYRRSEQGDGFGFAGEVAKVVGAGLAGMVLADLRGDEAVSVFPGDGRGADQLPLKL
jgi:hypothetical protein